MCSSKYLEDLGRLAFWQLACSTMLLGWGCTHVEADVNIVIGCEPTVLLTHDLELGPVLPVMPEFANVGLDPGSGGISSLVVAAQVLLLTATFLGMGDGPEGSLKHGGFVSHDWHAEVGGNW
jgi:hypothetical protein